MVKYLYHHCYSIRSLFSLLSDLENNKLLKSIQKVRLWIRSQTFDKVSILPDSQLSPEYPETQLQVNELIPSLHVPPFRHGFDSHSSISVSQLSPAYPTSQLQVYELTPSTQVPPFWHGLEEHSFMSAGRISI